VTKLCGEAIAKKSKDLQVAAWLVEALVRRDGFAGLIEGLALIRGLIENFWDTLYPELEDGMRSCVPRRSSGSAPAWTGRSGRCR